MSLNKDLVFRDDVLKYAEMLRVPMEHESYNDCRAVSVNDLLAVPAVDAEVVRHGRWIMRGGYIRCSECDAKTLWKDTGGTGGFSHEYEQVRSVHCHNCGAIMDAEVEG